MKLRSRATATTLYRWGGIAIVAALFSLALGSMSAMRVLVSLSALLVTAGFAIGASVSSDQHPRI